MGAFDDLVPQAPATSAFADLIPKQADASPFADLVPSAPDQPRVVASLPNLPSQDLSTDAQRQSIIDAAQARDAKNAALPLGQMLMTPGAEVIPKMTPEEAGKIANAADVSGLFHLLPKDVSDRVAGIGENVIADTANFFTSPVGIATVGMGTLPKLAQKAVSAAFLASTLKDAPERYEAIRDAKTPQERDEAITGAIESAAVIGGTAFHILDRARAASAIIAKPTANPAATVAPETSSALADAGVKNPATGPGSPALEPSNTTAQTQGQSLPPELPSVENPRGAGASTEAGTKVATAPVETAPLTSESAEVTKTGATEAPDQEPTGIRNSVVDQERAARGISPREEPIARAFGDVWDQAMQKFDVNPAAGRELVDSLSQNIRPLTDTEDAMLTHEQLTRQQAFDKAVENVNKAANPEDAADAQAQLSKARDDVQQIYDVGQRAGTESGRGLNARKLMVMRDYSLAKMEARERANNGGAPLGPDALAQVKAAHDRIAVLEKQISDNQAKQNDALASHYFDRLLKETSRDTKEAVKKGKSVSDFISDQADRARQRIRERGPRLTAGLDPVDLVDRAIIGADYLAKGVKAFGEWSAKMIGEFGEKIRPHLDDIFKKSNEYRDAHESIFSKTKPGEERAPADIAKQVKESAAAGQPLDHRTVYDLARAHVRAGVDGFDNVMRAVHGNLQEAIPGITERQVRDSFSEYGKVQFPSAEADKVKLAEYRRIGQLVSAIEDAEKGEVPKKTGMQRGKPTQTVREKMAELRAAMDKSGIETKSPEEQLASRNQARATALRNSIEDLDKRLKTGEKPTAGAKVPDSAEVERLRSERDSMKAKLKEIEDAAKPQKSPEEQLVDKTQKGVDAAAGALDRWDQILKGELKPESKTAKSPLSNLEEELRSQVDAMKQAYRELEAASRPKIDPEFTRQEAQLASLEKSITEYGRRVKEMDFSSPEKRPGPDTEVISKAKAARDAAKKVYDDLKKAQNPPKTPEQRRLDAYKTRLRNGAADIQKRIANNDYAARPKTELLLDREANELKAKREEAKQQFERRLSQQREAARPTYQKVLEQVSGLARSSALSGYHTLEKLGSFTLGKLGETPMNELTGAALSKIPGLRGVFERAPAEAGNTIPSLVRFYTSAATKGLREAARVLSQGQSETKALYGKPDYRTPHWYDFFGALHTAEKTPLLIGTKEMYVSRLEKAAIAKGLDINDEFVKAAINKEAYEHATSAILQEKNLVSEAVNGIHARMEKVNPKTGEQNINLAIISNLAKTFITKGIVKTPANYIAQTIARTPIGLAGGLINAAMAHARGIENLKPAEANATAKLLKVGAVGSAFFLLGAIDATKKKEDRTFGGYWEPGRKRDDGDVPWGALRVGGKSIPHIMTHNPLTESAQMGSTMMRVALSRYRKSDQDPQGLAEGAMKAVIGLASKAPIAAPIMRMSQDHTNFGTDLIKGLIPQLLQNIAEDRDSIRGIQRAPKTNADQLKMAVPFLRDQVPTKGGSATTHHRR